MSTVVTFSSSFELAGVLRRSSRLLLVLLTLTTLVKVLDDDSDEHVEYEERDQQQERNEVQQSPLVMIHLRLNDIKRTVYITTTTRKAQ